MPVHAATGLGRGGARSCAAEVALVVQGAIIEGPASAKLGQEVTAPMVVSCSVLGLAATPRAKARRPPGQRP